MAMDGIFLGRSLKAGVELAYILAVRPVFNFPYFAIRTGVIRHGVTRERTGRESCENVDYGSPFFCSMYERSTAVIE